MHFGTRQADSNASSNSKYAYGMRGEGWGQAVQEGGRGGAGILWGSTASWNPLNDPAEAQKCLGLQSQAESGGRGPATDQADGRCRATFGFRGLVR